MVRAYDGGREKKFSSALGDWARVVHIQLHNAHSIYAWQCQIWCERMMVEREKRKICSARRIGKGCYIYSFITPIAFMLGNQIWWERGGRGENGRGAATGEWVRVVCIQLHNGHSIHVWQCQTWCKRMMVEEEKRKSAPTGDWARTVGTQLHNAHIIYAWQCQICCERMGLGVRV